MHTFQSDILQGQMVVFLFCLLWESRTMELILELNVRILLWISSVWSSSSKFTCVEVHRGRLGEHNDIFTEVETLGKL